MAIVFNVGYKPMKQRAFLDWIAATVPVASRGEADLPAWGAEFTLTDAADWTPGKPRNGYKWAVDHPTGFQVMGGRPDMGTHFIAPGNALQEGRKGRLSTQWVMQALDRRNASYTRIDLALDVEGSGLAIDALADDYDHGRFVGQARKWSCVSTAEGGQCLYLGSRSSDFFERIYNKAAEQAAKANKPEALDWKRLELECKGSGARAVAYDLRTGADLAETTKSHLLSIADFPDNPTWARIFESTEVATVRSHRRLTNTEQWLLGTVAKSLAVMIRANPAFYSRFRRAVKAALLALDHGPSDRLDKI